MLLRADSEFALIAVIPSSPSLCTDYVLSNAERRAEYDSLRASRGSYAFTDGEEEKEQTSSASFFSSFFSGAGAAAGSSAGAGAGAQQGGQPQATGVFADVFEEMLRPEVHRVAPIWKVRARSEQLVGPSPVLRFLAGLTTQLLICFRTVDRLCIGSRPGLHRRQPAWCRRRRGHWQPAGRDPGRKGQERRTGIHELECGAACRGPGELRAQPARDELLPPRKTLANFCCAPAHTRHFRPFAHRRKVWQSKCSAQWAREFGRTKPAPDCFIHLAVDAAPPAYTLVSANAIRYRRASSSWAHRPMLSAALCF